MLCAHGQERVHISGPPLYALVAARRALLRADFADMVR
jgi:hypothetical protein